ncbi:tetratricopeptide repeat protein 21B-like isoform X1 [Rhopilema esculentum]|uniref:tetratricopeptide repeat protein 21B-like isoform X1 n=1 Tax=Rhopilema esculentum TaxID=499914 RepID=UPI0031D4C997
MAATDSVTLAKINYCCREGYYRQLQNICLESLQKYGHDPVLIFWKAFGILMEEQISEAISEFDGIKDKRDVILCSCMALIIAHKRTKMVDKETVKQLESKLKAERTSCGETALYFAGMFLFHSGKPDKAREYIDRMLKMSPQSKEGLMLRGWIDLKSSREQYTKKAIKFFDEVLNSPQSQKEIDAMLGKVDYLKMKNNFSGALELTNQLVVYYPDFYPALVEKMRLQLALQDWEQTLETAQRILRSEPHNIEAERMSVLFLLCRDGKYPEAVDRISDLIQTLDRVEPSNPYLHCSLAKGFSRVCGRNSMILQQTLTMLDRAKSSSSSSKADVMNEIGYQTILLGRHKDALKHYKQAMKIDESSVPALTGIIHCQILEGALDDAEQQLEFLSEIQESIGKSTDILFLSALLALKRGKPAEEVIKLLEQSMESHFGSLGGLPLGCLYFERLNPDFIIELAKVFLQFAPAEPAGMGQPVAPVLNKTLTILDPIVKTVPGLLLGHYYMAKTKYAMGDIDGAKMTLSLCLDSDPTFSDAHLLMAQIHLYNGNYVACDQSLENGLSYNFEVRNSPLYHIIKARAAKKMGKTEECLKTLKEAMSLPGLKKKTGPAKPGETSGLSNGDKVTLYLEIAEAHRMLNQTHEAAKVMQDAIHEFQGTPEETRVSIANAELSLARGDVEEALTTLRQISPEESYFVKAREKMAEIYLHHRKDKRLYASVYRELVEKNPVPQTYLLLGDAYMSIQEPEKAIEVYETALKRNPRDGSLASKIGQALIKTHQYGKAISYYEAAVKTGNQNFLRYDLAELYLKLKNYDKAEKVTLQAISYAKKSASDVSSLISATKFKLLLAKIYQNCRDPQETLTAFAEAKESQNSVLKRVGVEQPELLPAQKALSAQISCQMAEHYTNLKDYENAIKCYKEATFHNEADSEAMISLAKLYLTTGDHNACQHQLTNLLKSDQDNDAATVMMADLMFRKIEYESAIFHFQKLLGRTPEHYEALAKYVDLMKRAGQLVECKSFIEMAGKANARASVDPGYNYCKGLYEWFQNNATAALRHFNLARKDTYWGEKALYNMVEICLNPDSDIIGAETFEAVDDNSTVAERQSSEEMALRTAEKLLKEIKPKGNTIKHKVLSNYALMAEKNKSKTEKALSAFMELASVEKDYVPALLGMATAYMMLKQTPRARNQLKRVDKLSWNSEDANEFEKSWLLLADIYIQSGKYDMAQGLLKKCLQYNKSCTKAWEYMGFIMEKEQAYKDAAYYYENAWTNCNESNPAIGYKLGFNYLKAKRFVDAIDVCHKVLEKQPNYPKIRKDILDKARHGLRV